MKISGIPFSVFDFSVMPREEHRGERGSSSWTTAEAGDTRMRVVVYEPGFFSDHWCEKGHMVYVLEGCLTLELMDGRSLEISANSGFIISDNAEPHRAGSASGARMLIID